MNDWKRFYKNYVTIALNALYAIKGKYIMLMFQNVTQTEKSKLLF